MTLTATAFTLIAYGLLALVAVLYVVLLKSLFTRDTTEESQ